MVRSLGFLGGDKFAMLYPKIKQFIHSLNEIPIPVTPGVKKYPGHTVFWNAAMKSVAQTHGWSVQPRVLPGPNQPIGWTGDFSLTMQDGLRVFVEIELGNAASAFRNFSKFDIATQLDTYDLFLLGVPGPKGKLLTGYASDFDYIEKRQDFYRKFVHAPCCVFEIEPKSECDILAISGVSPNEIIDRPSEDWALEFIKNHKLEPHLNLEEVID